MVLAFNFTIPVKRIQTAFYQLPSSVLTREHKNQVHTWVPSHAGYHGDRTQIAFYNRPSESQHTNLYHCKYQCKLSLIINKACLIM